MRLPNGFGSIHKLSGKRRKPYRARVTTGWDINGKQIYLTVGYFETYKEAFSSLAEYHNNPYKFTQKDITLEYVYEKWWATKKDSISKSSITGYNSAYKNCERIKNMPFNEIKLYHLQEIVDSMENRWGANKKFKVLFNQLYDFAIANDLASKKYSSYINLGEKTTKIERHPFTGDEINKLWENVGRMEYIDVILIYIYTGFRPSELLEIKKNNGVNLEEQYLMGGSKTKAGKDRIVPIHHKILPFIENWYYKENDYLIFNSKNEKMKYRNWKDEKFNVIMKQLGMKHLPHDTRHTFATEMDNAGANKLCIQRIMGHASKDITDKVYTHKDIEELRKAIELLP